MQPAVIVVLLTLLALALILLTIGYYLWLARHVAPRVAFLPTRVAIMIVAMWIALPWLVVTAAAWLVLR